MPATYDRDLIGYGANPPDPKWPGGARLAVNFVMNYEEGSEPSVQDGEGFTEVGLTEAHGLGQGVKGRDLAAEGMFEYGSRVGFWRLMRLFQEREPADDGVRLRAGARAQPAAAAAIRAVRLRRLLPRLALGQALRADRGRGARAHRARRSRRCRQTVGERPLGWYCRYGPSVNTRRLLVEEGGFLYDQRLLRRRAAVLADGRRQAAPGRALLAHQQRRQVRRPASATADQWFALRASDAFDVLYKRGRHAAAR